MFIEALEEEKKRRLKQQMWKYWEWGMNPASHCWCFNVLEVMYQLLLLIRHVKLWVIFKMTGKKTEWAATIAKRNDNRTDKTWKNKLRHIDFYKGVDFATRPQSWSGAAFEFKGVVCKKWPEFKGNLQNCRGQQNRLSLRWTPYCLFVLPVDRFHIFILNWMINLHRSRGDCGNETKAVMAGLMSFKSSFTMS